MVKWDHFEEQTHILIKKRRGPPSPNNSPYTRRTITTRYVHVSSCELCEFTLHCDCSVCNNYGVVLDWKDYDSIEEKLLEPQERTLKTLCQNMIISSLNKKSVDCVLLQIFRLPLPPPLLSSLGDLVLFSEFGRFVMHSAYCDHCLHDVLISNFPYWKKKKSSSS